MNKLKEEYIGSEIEITKSKNKTLEGLKGVVIDETKNTFKIKTQNKTRTVLKKISTFKINEREIIGEQIVKRPHDRIKIKGER
ncbi:MAG: ribonuclease P protein subunit [Nanoarchaeota archaeon]|nr:ribonuclease P protein subunit [Nanoarchaeota archaeon]MBU1269135.1 ribonuclease P protein subunit [Nanoarchaeota archaeon]MBU1605097.1 ribonuclease P protein subunit [Nanoarchaeota archaeon]MBU2442778.1 ribonuclease P protein subunit [Nanoarchaeota archaeon]